MAGTIRRGKHGHMLALAGTMQASLSKDDCGERCVIGKRGTVHADGEGYALYLECEDGKQLAGFWRALRGFCRMRQHGDCEMVCHFGALPSAHEAKVLRRVLQIRKLPGLTVRQRHVRRALGLKHGFERRSVLARIG